MARSNYARCDFTYLPMDSVTHVQPQRIGRITNDNDPSIAWPDNRKRVLLGRLEIKRRTANTAEEDRRLAFNSSNVPTGIETADMLSSFFNALRLSAVEARDVALLRETEEPMKSSSRLKINEIVT